VNSAAAAPRRGFVLGRLWRGELPVHDAFWTWAVLIAFLVNVSTTIACYLLAIADHAVLALAIGYLPSVPYNIVAGVGAWRSASRPEADPLFARFVRIVIIPMMVVFSVT
jgi:hypothetical protein